MASGDFRYLLIVFREMSNSLAISRTPCLAPFSSYISFTSATFSNAPVHLRENYADDDTYLRWVNSNLLLLLLLYDNVLTVDSLGQNAKNYALAGSIPDRKLNVRERAKGVVTAGLEVSRNP